MKIEFVKTQRMVQYYKILIYKMYLIFFFFFFRFLLIFENRITRKYYFVNFYKAFTQTRIYVKTRFSRGLNTISRDEWKLRVSLSLSNAHTETHLKQNSDTEIHEWLGEIYHALPSVIDRHGCDGQIRSLWAKGKFLAWKHVVLTHQLSMFEKSYRKSKFIGNGKPLGFSVITNEIFIRIADNYTERRS